MDYSKYGKTEDEYYKFIHLYDKLFARLRENTLHDKSSEDVLWMIEELKKEFRK